MAAKEWAYLVSPNQTFHGANWRNQTGIGVCEMIVLWSLYSQDRIFANIMKPVAQILLGKITVRLNTGPTMKKQPETSTLERALSFQEWSDLHPDMVERELGYVVYRFVQGHDSLKTPSSARQLLENNQGLTSAQPNPSDDPSGYDAYGRPYQTDNGEGSSRSAQNTHHTTHHESGGPNVFGYEEK
nr:uncharacterized protein CI109_005681 [Kwoniella shandongensis]KAA5525934.1 hypothetical protein CI109_005681 [Kwoniella shandongensis]